jgi:Fe/S biogenesis protein NfuA
MLKEDVPEILHVVDQTDHAGGSNPYYQPSK